jgi:hypothetical protein
VRQSDDDWVETTVFPDRALLNTGSAVSPVDFWITRCGDLTASVNRSTENSLFSEAAADRITTAFALLDLFKLQSSCPYYNCRRSRPLPLPPKVKGDASGSGGRSGERMPACCGRCKSSRCRLIAVVAPFVSSTVKLLQFSPPQLRRPRPSLLRDLHLLSKRTFRGRPPLGRRCKLAQDSEWAKETYVVEAPGVIAGHKEVWQRPGSLAEAAGPRWCIPEIAPAVPRTLELAPPAPEAAPVPTSLTPVCSKLMLGKTLSLYSPSRHCCSTQPHGHDYATLLHLFLVTHFPQLGSSARLESLALSLHSFQSCP